MALGFGCRFSTCSVSPSTRARCVFGEQEQSCSLIQTQPGQGFAWSSGSSTSSCTNQTKPHAPTSLRSEEGKEPTRAGEDSYGSPPHPHFPSRLPRQQGSGQAGIVARLQQAPGAQELPVLCPHKSFAIPPEQFSRQQRGCIPFPIS